MLRCFSRLTTLVALAAVAVSSALASPYPGSSSIQKANGCAIVTANPKNPLDCTVTAGKPGVGIIQFCVFADAPVGSSSSSCGWHSTSDKNAGCWDIGSTSNCSHNTIVCKGEPGYSGSPCSGRFVGHGSSCGHVTCIAQCVDLHTGQKCWTYCCPPSGKNHPPCANDDCSPGFSTKAGTPIVISTSTLLANDTDADGNTLTIISVTANSANGTVKLSTDGKTITYTPKAGFRGNDSFTYTASDGNGGTDTAKVCICVTNNTPNANNDCSPGFTSTGSAITITAASLLANDTDADADTLTITSVGHASHGTVTLSADHKTITYTPTSGYRGTDSFTYAISDGNGGCDSATVCITVTGNRPPCANDDCNQNFHTPGATALTISAASLLANDTDADHDTLSIIAVTNGAHGTAVLSADHKTIVYTPTKGYKGADSFTYTASDGKGGTDTAKVCITITNNPPTANDDCSLNLTSANGAPIVIPASTLLANDTDKDGDTLTIVSVTNGAHGTVTLSADKKTVTYTPTAGYTGTDTFTYVISDGTCSSSCAKVCVSVNGNHKPTPHDDCDTPGIVGVPNKNITISSSTLLVNDTDADGNTLSVIAVTNGANGTTTLSADKKTITYVPSAGFRGTDSFTYTVSDGKGGTATAKVCVTVNNTPPTPHDDCTPGFITVEGKSLTITAGSLLFNDTDADGDTLTIISVTDGANGTATLSPDGSTIVYTPTPGFRGADSFTYTVSDGHGGTATAKVCLTVNDNPPTPGDHCDVHGYSGLGGQPITILSSAVIAGDTDVDGDTLSVTAVGNGANGTVTLSADGQTIVYTPNPGFRGNDTFSYTLSDGFTTVNGSICVVVNDNPPTTTDNCTISGSTSEGVPAIIDLSGNVDDADGDTLTLTIVTPPAHGTYSISGLVVTYTPNAGYIGTDGFTFNVSDGYPGGVSNTSSVCLVVTNTPPVAYPDCDLNLADTAGTTLTIPAATLLANDTDADGDTLTITGVTPDSANGTVTLSADGKFVYYTGKAGYNGSDSFHYTITDGHGGVSSAQVCVTVICNCSGILILGPDISNEIANYVASTDAALSSKITNVVTSPASYDANALGKALDAKYAKDGIPYCAILIDTEFFGPQGTFSGLSASDEARLKAEMLKGTGFVYPEPTDPSTLGGHFAMPLGQFPNTIPVVPSTYSVHDIVYVTLDPTSPLAAGIPGTFAADSSGQDDQVLLSPPVPGVSYTNVDEVAYSSSPTLPNGYIGLGGPVIWTLNYGPAASKVAIIGTDPYVDSNGSSVNLPVINKLYYNALKYASGL